MTGGNILKSLYIMVDLEGICGIYDREQVMPAGERYYEGRMFMTQDINVCVEAAKEAGVEKIYVRDSHGNGRSIIWEKLSPKADYYIAGKNANNRWPGLDECEGVILLGFHAMAGASNAILEHTMSSASIQNYWINGMKAGETAVEAAIAGDHGKPVIMISGDDKVCAEAKAILPWIVTAEVKKGLGTYYAMLLPQERAHALLREKTIEAVKNFPNTKPYILTKPITLRIERMERIQLPANKPYLKVIDGRTTEVSGPTMEETLLLNY